MRSAQFYHRRSPALTTLPPLHRHLYTYTYIHQAHCFPRPERTSSKGGGGVMRSVVSVGRRYRHARDRFHVIYFCERKRRRLRRLRYDKDDDGRRSGEGDNDGRMDGALSQTRRRHILRPDPS